MNYKNIIKSLYFIFILFIFQQNTCLESTTPTKSFKLPSDLLKTHNESIFSKVWENYKKNRGWYFLGSTGSCALLAYLYFKSRGIKPDTQERTFGEKILKGSSIGFAGLSLAMILHSTNFKEVADFFAKIFAATVAQVAAERATNAAIDKVFGERKNNRYIIL